MRGTPHAPRPALDTLDLLTKVGGLEIAGLAGVILGAAAARRPVVLDGFISGAAALIAAGLAPDVAPFCFAAHRSVEAGHRVALKALGLSRLIVFLGKRSAELETQAAFADDISAAGLPLHVAETVPG